jgi:hypothetical protein
LVVRLVQKVGGKFRRCYFHGQRQQQQQQQQQPHSSCLDVLRRLDFEIAVKTTRLWAYFINILQESFSYESALRSFFLITFCFLIIWRNNIGKKAACKMLMKSTSGRNKS